MARLLIVDDDERARGEAARVARSAAPETELTLVSHAEAASAAKQAAFDAILLDLNDTESSCEEVIASLRAREVWAPIVVVLETNDAEHAMACMRAGAIDCIPRSAFAAERLASALISVARTSDVVTRQTADVEEEDRRTAQLAHLVEASLVIMSEPTFKRVAESAVRAIGTIFDTRARVVITRCGRELAVWPEEPLGPEAGERMTVALPENAQGLAGTLEIVLPEHGFDSPARLTLAHLERVTLSSAERLTLLAEAQESARERQEIVAIVSHDLRTPLQTFAMGLDAIELSVGETARKKIAGTTARMKRSIGTMTRLLGDLLDVSRIHDSVLPMRFAPHALKPLIDELRDLYLPMVEKSGITLTAKVDPELTVVCDGARISQALGNLVSNAIRHTERGSITITVESTADAGVRFEVRDTGTGIAKDVRARLFDRLYQGDSSGRSGGLGLGLYIVKGIADAHGGSVGVESELGRGTTFWIELPNREPS